MCVCACVRECVRMHMNVECMCAQVHVNVCVCSMHVCSYEYSGTSLLINTLHFFHLRLLLANACL